jgi:hypothetical protein
MDWTALFRLVYALDMRELRIPSKAAMIRKQMRRQMPSRFHSPW